MNTKSGVGSPELQAFSKVTAQRHLQTKAWIYTHRSYVRGVWAGEGYQFRLTVLDARHFHCLDFTFGAQSRDFVAVITWLVQCRG
jgi:hypothetical protein